jgi:hypothetical protein
MRTFAGFCLTATLLTAPAFAQAPGQAASPQPASPQGGAPLSAASSAKSAASAVRESDASQMKFSLGVLDRLTIQRGADASDLPVAPIERDQLALSWRPTGKWGITLDLTSRSQNDLRLPKEELSAGAYYQVTPRFRFGGGLTLNGDNLRSAANNWSDREKGEGEAGVRIQSAFSF